MKSNFPQKLWPEFLQPKSYYFFITHTASVYTALVFVYDKLHNTQKNKNKNLRQKAKGCNAKRSIFVMTMACTVVKNMFGTLTARSTICNFPILRCCWPSSPFSLLSIVMVNIAWEREDVAFMLVDPTAPNSRIYNIDVSWSNQTNTAKNPLIDQTNWSS